MNGSRMYDQLQAMRRLFTKNLVPTITVNVVMSLLCRSIRHAAVSPVIIFSFTVACCSKVVMFQLLDNTTPEITVNYDRARHFNTNVQCTFRIS